MRAVQSRTPELIEWLIERREKAECGSDCPEREWEEEERAREKRLTESTADEKSAARVRVCYHSERLSHATDLVALVERRLQQQQ